MVGAYPNAKLDPEPILNMPVGERPSPSFLVGPWPFSGWRPIPHASPFLPSLPFQGASCCFQVDDVVGLSKRDRVTCEEFL